MHSVPGCHCFPRWYGCSRAPPGWARRVFWALVGAGHEAAKADGTPKHQIVAAIMTSLTEGTINPKRA